ncbi:MAG: hypothetical protein ABH849_03570 [Nanoarchaeota archaeon]
MMDVMLSKDNVGIIGSLNKEIFDSIDKNCFLAYNFVYQRILRNSSSPESKTGIIPIIASGIFCLNKKNLLEKKNYIPLR